MKNITSLNSIASSLFITLIIIVQYVKADKKIICYYNSTSHYRQPANGKFDIESSIDPALQICTHLVYGYATIDPQTYELKPLNIELDITRAHYKLFTDLKRRVPGLIVLLSVGGKGDVGGERRSDLKYRTLLESSASRSTFVRSARNLLQKYSFDGLDLAWEFPETKPKEIRGKLNSFLIYLKNKIVGESVIDTKTEEHKEQFVGFVRELKNQFIQDGLLLSLSVLPNINSSVYYDAKALSQHLDFINLMAFDFYTPERNPNEADYPAPLYELHDRKSDENADYQVRFWLHHGTPSKKLILGIPAYGRAWRMSTDSSTSGVPPLNNLDGPAEGINAGPGLLSYSEMCFNLDKGYWNKSDVTTRYGTFAFRLPDAQGKNGVWAGYEDPETAGNKAAYAKAKGLAGIAVCDITLDDFGGVCSRGRYPILLAAKYRL